MKSMKVSAALLMFLLLCTSFYAKAGNQWVICNVEINIDKVLHQERMLSAHVTKLIGAQAPTCPALGTQLTFTPETANYQNELPKRLWPRVGSKAKLQYRYLNGICKERGPCTIEHYSII